MLGKPLYHVAAIETAAQNAVECYHHLCHLILQSQVYQTEIVVAVEHVQVLDTGVSHTPGREQGATVLFLLRVLFLPKKGLHIAAVCGIIL